MRFWKWAALYGAMITAVTAMAVQDAKAQDAGYFAQISYTGSGSQNLYSIPFPYISAGDLVVSVGGVYLSPSQYTVPSVGQLNITTAPAAATPVLIRRITRTVPAEATFSGGTLSSAALNLNQTQDLYLAQEAQDATKTLALQVNGLNTLVNYTAIPAPVDARLYGVLCNNLNDDTVGLQNAVNSGAKVILPAGICKTSATINWTSAATQGGGLQGAGETDQGLLGSGKTIVRPSAAVTTAFKIDGTPFSGYTQGVRFADFTLDMVNMAAGSKGFLYGQSFDNSQSHIRVANDTLKDGWLMQPGAYVLHLDTISGHTVECIGTGVNNPTTLVITNPDILQLDAALCANVTTVGGAIQFGWNSGTTPQWVASGNTNMLGFYDTVAAFNSATGGTGGFYMALGSYFDNMQNLTSSGTDWEVIAGNPGNACTPIAGGGTWGYGTYNDGTHGCHPIVWALSISGTVRDCLFDNPVFAGLYLYSPTNNGCTVRGYTLSGVNRSQNITNVYDIHNSATWINNGQALYGYSDNGITSTFLLDASTGSLNWTGGTLKPRTDGTNFLIVQNALGTTLGGIFSSATAANSTFFFNHFTASDGTHTASMDQNGLVIGNQVKAQPTTDSTTTFVGLNAAGTQLVNFTPNVVPSSSQWAFANGIQVIGFSDNFSVTKWTLDSSTGNFTTVGELLGSASTTARASLNLPHGAAPTTPTNGDVWTTTAGMFARINGGTVGPFGSGGAASPITSTSANAFAVGPAGNTNPSFNVDASTASAATGINVKSAAAAGGVALSAISSGVNEALKIDAKGSGTITLGGTSTGAIIHTQATTLTGALTYGGVTLTNNVTGTGKMVLDTSAALVTPAIGAATGTSLALTGSSANILTAGLNGTTNPAFNVDASTASSATGLKVKSAAAAAGVALSVVSSGTNENLTLDAKGSGTLTLNGTATGGITLTRAATLSGALTYGGVTLSNAVTGTGSMALSTSPAFTTPTLGVASGNSLTITPTADGQMFTLANLGASTYYLCQSAATVANSLCAVGNSAKIKGFSDSGFSTQTFLLDSSTGTATFNGNGTFGSLKAQPGTDGNNIFIIANAAAAQLMNCATNITASSSVCAFANSIKISGYSDGAFSTLKWRLDGGTGSILSAGTGGVGYSTGTGAGGAVTQITSRTTGVTLNTPTGAITLVSAAGSTTYSSFTVTDSAVVATDTIVLNEKSGTDKYILLVTAVAAGSFQISAATTGGTTTEQPVINFAVIKGAAS